MAGQRRTPGSQTSLREANRARIIDAVKKHGGLTQVELAGATGLSAATVSNIVKELTGSGVLHTTPTTRSGRLAQHVTLAHALGLVVGVHVGQRHLRVALSDVAGTVVTETHMPLAKDHRADNELDRVAILLRDMLDSVDASAGEVLAMGIALPAPYDPSTGTIARLGMMRGWDGVRIAEVMERRIRRPVFVDNSSNLAALAELRLGALRGRENAVYIEVGEGIGAGLVIGGRVVHGHNGTAGEFGHITVNEFGPLCRCGNRGCLEAIAGARAIVESVGDERAATKLSDIVIGAMSGDDAFIRKIADTGRTVGMAAANLCNILDPERLVIGGELARAGELLLGPLRHAVERNVIGGVDRLPEVVAGQLGDRDSTLGAIAYAVDELALEDRAATGIALQHPL